MLPTGSRRPPQIAHYELVEHDTQRIDVRLHCGDAAGRQFGRAIERRSAARLGFGCSGRFGLERRNAESTEARRIQCPTAAEIRQTNVRIAVRVEMHQYVGRLQVLVQHAHRMGGREGVGNLRDEIETYRHGNRVRAALPVRPFPEIALAAPFDLDEIGRFLQVPVDDAGYVVTRTQAVLKQAEEGDLAPKCREPDAVMAKLEDPALVGFRLLPEPCIAKPAGAEPPDHSPVRP